MCARRCQKLSHFNPRSSCEERRPSSATSAWCGTLFQSTLLMRGATVEAEDEHDAAEIISIHAPHARSDEKYSHITQDDLGISIHAPHARSDGNFSDTWGSDPISIHAPHARSDARSLFLPTSFCQFQSTLLMRGATRWRYSRYAPAGQFQSTLLMRGATRSGWPAERPAAEFQSTLLMRGATSVAYGWSMADR